MSQISTSVGVLEEGIDEGGLRVRDHQHVALVDRLPAADRRAVEALAVFERALVDEIDGVRAVLPGSGPVGEPQVHHDGTLFFLRTPEPLWRSWDRSFSPSHVVGGRGSPGGSRALSVLARARPRPDRARRSGCGSASSIEHEDLAVADAAGVGRLDDRRDRLVRHLVATAISILIFGRKSTTYSAPR